MGLRWTDHRTTHMDIRPDLINGAGFLSGVATYAMIDYTMGSTLWRETADDEGIATLNIAINYLQTAREGEVRCRTVLDRRNRSVGVLRSEVRADDDRLLVTALGSYAIFPRDRLRRAS
jgi:acyl-coenzyme A thioesterase PaaI-like protein